MRNSSMLTFHSSFNSKAKREPQNSVCVRFKRRSVVAVCEHVEHVERTAYESTDVLY